MDFDNRFPDFSSKNDEIESVLAYLQELRGQLSTLEAEIKRIVAGAVDDHISAYHGGGS